MTIEEEGEEERGEDELEDFPGEDAEDNNMEES